VEQESLANAKVSARNSACMNAPSEEIYDKSTQRILKSTFGELCKAVAGNTGLFFRLAVVASKTCEIPRDVWNCLNE